MWAVVLTTVHEQEKKKDFVTLFLHVRVKKTTQQQNQTNSKQPLFVRAHEKYL